MLPRAWPSAPCPRALLHIHPLGGWTVLFSEQQGFLEVQVPVQKEPASLARLLGLHKLYLTDYGKKMTGPKEHLTESHEASVLVLLLHLFPEPQFQVSQELK